MGDFRTRWAEAGRILVLEWDTLVWLFLFYFIFPVWLFLNWYEQETVGTLGKIQRSWANPHHPGGSLQLILMQMIYS